MTYEELVNEPPPVVPIRIDDDLLKTPAGNAWGLLGWFSRSAKEAGWVPEDVEVVMNQAMSGNYAHLVRTLRKFSVRPEEDA